jgi:CRP-like cAMP-binding protein
LDEVLHRFEQAQQTIRRLSADSAQQRVAAALLGLVDKLGVAQDRALVLEVHLTRVDVAALTGLTPETVSRVMSRLRDAGIVDTGRLWTVILDRTRLAAEAAE